VGPERAQGLPEDIEHKAHEGNYTGRPSKRRPAMVVRSPKFEQRPAAPIFENFRENQFRIPRELVIL
jgi:hypothetical protein